MKNIKNFNWIKELNKAIKKSPSPDMDEELKRRASLWPTCAVGVLCKSLPKDHLGMPDDLKLYKLAINFDNAIYTRKYNIALGIFNKIEERTLELLAQSAAS